MDVSERDELLAALKRAVGHYVALFVFNPVDGGENVVEGVLERVNYVVVVRRGSTRFHVPFSIIYMFIDYGGPG